MARNWKQPQTATKSTQPHVQPANPKARRSFVLDPHYRIEALALPDINLFATGMDWLSKDQLAICTYTGEVWIVENATGPVKEMKYRRFARGMNEPMGLLVKDGKIHLGNKAELTRLTDTDNDGQADLFERVCNDWDYTGSYNSSFHRCYVSDPNHLVMFFERRHLWDYYVRAEQANGERARSSPIWVDRTK